MFESVIREAADRFHLGGNAGALVKALVDAIFNDNTGGFAGFRNRFADAGLGDLFGSWIGTTPGDNVLQPDQFAAGFGSGAASDLASKLGIPASAVNMAGAFLLPKLVGALTPGGQIPTSRPSWLNGLFGSLGGAAAGAAGAAAGAASAVGGAARGAASAAATTGGGGFWKWLIPLLVLAAVFFGYRSCHRQAADTTPATGTTAPAAAASTTMPAVASTTMPATDASTAMPAAASVAAPNAAAEAALSSIQPGASVGDVTKALNLMIIHFATGSANIDQDSDAILKKASDAIKSVPAGTKLEVGGHTDNTGNAAANMALSQRRANAVVTRLVELGVAAGTLSGKGYGDTKPVADNATDAGRAQNRRIEFTATQ